VNRRSLIRRALALLGIGAGVKALPAAEPTVAMRVYRETFARAGVSRLLWDDVYRIDNGGGDDWTIAGRWRLARVEGGPITVAGEAFECLAEKVSAELRQWDAEGREKSRYCVVSVSTRELRERGVIAYLYFERIPPDDDATHVRLFPEWSRQHRT
jgi:hypothetical protein